MSNRNLSCITPGWADKKAIREFILSCPEGFHVDHIIPINAANVCGLHVLENLQHIDANSNLWKKNRYHPMSLEAAVCPLVDYKSVAGHAKKARTLRKSKTKKERDDFLSGSTADWENFAKVAYENGYMTRCEFDYITMVVQNISAHESMEYSK